MKTIFIKIVASFFYSHKKGVQVFYFHVKVVTAYFMLGYHSPIAQCLGIKGHQPQKIFSMFSIFVFLLHVWQVMHENACVMCVTKQLLSVLLAKLYMHKHIHLF